MVDKGIRSYLPFVIALHLLFRDFEPDHSSIPAFDPAERYVVSAHVHESPLHYGKVWADCFNIADIMVIARMHCFMDEVYPARRFSRHDLQLLNDYLRLSLKSTLAFFDR